MAIYNNGGYKLDLIKAAIKEAGGKNVRQANQFGWSNQPKVVTFSADRKELVEKIERHVAFVCRYPDWAIIAARVSE
jgi:hypothetical protein